MVRRGQDPVEEAHPAMLIPDDAGGSIVVRGRCTGSGDKRVPVLVVFIRGSSDMIVGLSSLKMDIHDAYLARAFLDATVNKSAGPIVATSGEDEAEGSR